MEYSSASARETNGLNNACNFLQEALRKIFKCLGLDVTETQAGFAANIKNQNHHYLQETCSTTEALAVTINSRNMPLKSEISRGGGAEIN